MQIVMHIITHVKNEVNLAESKGGYHLQGVVEDEGWTFSLLKLDSPDYRNLVERFNEAKL